MVRKIDFSAITDEIKKNETKQDYTDPLKEKLYSPKLGKDGTFSAIIRFLPRHEDDSSVIPYVKLMNHVFQTKIGQWVYENCPTTLGKTQKCPICELNTEDWADESKHGTVRKRTRRINYYSNILVVNDPQNPDNNGKVFIFKYGKGLFEKILEKLSPQDGSIDEPVNIFDYTDGQNFKLKIRLKGEGKESWPNYDQSGFTGTSTPIYTDESKFDELDKKLHMLGDIASNDKFKSYEEIKTSLVKKMGLNDSKESSLASTKKPVKQEVLEEDEEDVKPSKPKISSVVTDSFDDEDEFLKELDDE